MHLPNWLVLLAQDTVARMQCLSNWPISPECLLHVRLVHKLVRKS